MKGRGLLVSTFLLWGCSMGSGPELVAHEFWQASKNGDADRARELVLSTSSAEINDPDDGEKPIGDFSLGEAEVDGDEATVETTISGLAGLDGDSSSTPSWQRRTGPGKWTSIGPRET